MPEFVRCNLLAIAASKKCMERKPNIEFSVPTALVLCSLPALVWRPSP